MNADYDDPFLSLMEKEVFSWLCLCNWFIFYLQMEEFSYMTPNVCIDSNLGLGMGEMVGLK